MAARKSGFVRSNFYMASKVEKIRRLVIQLFVYLEFSIFGNSYFKLLFSSATARTDENLQNIVDSNDIYSEYGFGVDCLWWLAPVPV